MKRVHFGVLTTLTDVVRVQEALKFVFVCIVQWPPQLIGKFVSLTDRGRSIQQGLQSPALRRVARHTKRPSARESQPEAP